ncbi:MAG: hypothetical protein WCI76_01925, partial [bacterium]
MEAKPIKKEKSEAELSQEREEILKTLREATAALEAAEGDVTIPRNPAPATETKQGAVIKPVESTPATPEPEKKQARIELPPPPWVA